MLPLPLCGQRVFSANASAAFSILPQLQLRVSALSRDTARAATGPKCTAMGVGRDNARQCYKRIGMCTQAPPQLCAVVPLVRLLSEVVRHDVGAFRGRSFQIASPA